MLIDRRVVELEVVLFILDLGLQIYGILSAFVLSNGGNSIMCFQSSPLAYLTIVRIVIIWTFVVDSLYLFVVLVLVYSSISNHTPLNSDFNEYMALWKKRIEWFISSPTARKSEGQQVISQLSLMLANYFKDVDWAPSDMAVGLLLLKREQKLLGNLAKMSSMNGQDIIENQEIDPELENDDDSGYEMQHLTRSASARVASASSVNRVEHDLSGEFSKQDNSEKATKTLDKVKPKQSLATLFKEITKKRQQRTNKNIEEVEEEENHQEIVERNSKLFSQVSEYLSSISPKDSEGKPMNMSMKRKSISPGILNSPNVIQESANSRRSLHFDRQQTSNGRRNSTDWRFASYSFKLPLDIKNITNVHIQDVIHFMHYANMAYVELDAEIQKKTDALLHFNPLNDIFRAPYLVSVDHDWNSIVIAIRGTMTVADLLVDLKLEMEILDNDLEYPERYRVHSGMYITAKNIVAEIVEHQVLQNLFQENGRLSEYNIVVCGHSLGAVYITNSRVSVLLSRTC